MVQNKRECFCYWSHRDQHIPQLLNLPRCGAQAVRSTIPVMQISGRLFQESCHNDGLVSFEYCLTVCVQARCIIGAGDIGQTMLSSKNSS